MKYKIVKPITVRTVFENLPRDCESALSEFLIFLDELRPSMLQLDKEMSEELVNDLISKHQTWEAFLLNQHLIDVHEPELTFSIGDKFQSLVDRQKRWILASVDTEKQINLIAVWPPQDINMGSRFSIESVSVNDLRNITLREFEKLIGGEYVHMLRRTNSVRASREKRSTRSHPDREYRYRPRVNRHFPHPATGDLYRGNY